MNNLLWWQFKHERQVLSTVYLYDFTTDILPNLGTLTPVPKEGRCISSVRLGCMGWD